mgnify:CR=1 FL=1
MEVKEKMLSSLQKGINAAKAGRKGDALKFLKDAILEEPHNAGVWVWIAALNQDSAQQEVFLQRALTVDPTSISAQQGLAFLKNNKHDRLGADLESLSKPAHHISKFFPKKGPAPQRHPSEHKQPGFVVINGIEKTKSRKPRRRSERKSSSSPGGGKTERKRFSINTPLLVLGIVVFFIIGFLAFSAAYDFSLPFDLSVHNPFQDAPDQPEIRIRSKTAQSMDLIVHFPVDPIQNPASENAALFNEAFYDHPPEPGVPDLPVLYEAVEIPTGEEVEIQVLDSKSSTHVLGEGNLPDEIPNREPDVEKCSPEALCRLAVFSLPLQRVEIFPQTPAKLTRNVVIRGHQIAQLEFWPVQYDPTAKTVEIYEEIKLRILVSEPDQRSPGSKTKVASETFDGLLADTVLNFQPLVSEPSDRSPKSEGYLIIAPDAFISSLYPLVGLKELHGYSVTLVGLSTTGKSATQIRDYIQNAYNYWANPPTYVLLVGDVDNGDLSLPAYIGYSTDSVTDLYYGTVDGSDWIPDIFVGRIPARSISQLNTMISNLISYENLTGMESWIKQAALLASDDPVYWQIAEGTQNYVVETHTLPADYAGIFPTQPQAGGDKLYAYSYGAETANVLKSMQTGHSLVAYTGHGSTFSWGEPAFTQENIRSIPNNGAFSVVASFSCDTGEYGSIESFGETWLLQPNKGAVAFIGASANSYWGGDDIMERAMMDSLYGGEEGANIVGRFKFAGLMAVEGVRPGIDTGQSRYYWESYNLFGDPALEMRVAPKTFAEYKPSLSASSVEAAGAPGKDALVQLALKNAGEYLDTFAIDIMQGGWESSLRNSNLVELSPGETTTLELVIRVPEDAVFGQNEVYILNVASLKDPENPPASDQAKIQLRVANQYIFSIFYSP